MKPPINIRVLLAAAGILGAVVLLRGQSGAGGGPSPKPIPNYRVVSTNLTLRELSPVVYFRGLLGMTPAERAGALAGKPAEYQKAVLEKVREYEALPKDIREARLSETQWRWEIITLMKTPAADRATLLRSLPTTDRAELEKRLRIWDQLPADDQKSILEKENFLDFYLRWLASSPAETTSQPGFPPVGAPPGDDQRTGPLAEHARPGTPAFMRSV